MAILYKSSFVHHLTKIAVEVMFFGGLVCFALVPVLLPKVIDAFGYHRTDVLPLMAVLLSSGLCSLYILWQLKIMLKTLLGGNPFVYDNAACMRKCAVASMLISLIYLVKIVFWFTLASTVIVIIFFLLSLFCLTLKDVFKQAVAYKEENDWTV